MTELSQGIINHVVFLLDASSSMQRLAVEVVKVADKQIADLASLSTQMNQETRATVYTFSSFNKFDCAYYDKDVLRLQSLVGKYHVGGNTALIDATMRAIAELEQTATLYGDHAFLFYALTDGQENDSIAHSPRQLQERLARQPDNWTTAALVPDVRGEAYAQQYGFLSGNIAIWSTTEAGVREVGKKIHTATQQFMQGRALGVRGSKNLFQASTNLNDLSVLKPAAPDTYEILVVGPGEQRQIRDFVEQESTRRRRYTKGCAYYQLSKTEEVQPTKEMLVLDIGSNKLYTDAREAVGIPKGVYVDVAPESHADKVIFVQSTSVNRKLVPNTMVVVR